MALFSPLPSKVISFFLCLFTLLSPASAFKTPTPLVQVDPFKDPEHDVRNPLRYIASNTLTTIAVVFILIVAILQTVWIFKWGAKWMMAMTIGAYCFAVGIALRYGLHYHPHSRGISIAEYLFVTLSPCAFIAADYVLLGRLAVHLNADRYLMISSRRLTLVFILSDVFTFLVQAAGGSISTSSDTEKMINLGSRVFLVGLALQMASFALFASVYAVFLYRVFTKEKEIMVADDSKPWYNRWTMLATALVFSCIGILIRSCFRTAELSGGFGSPLSRSERLFYGLDTLPLFIAISVYVPFWPGRFIKDGQTLGVQAVDNENEVKSVRGNSLEKSGGTVTVEPEQSTPMEK